MRTWIAILSTLALIAFLAWGGAASTMFFAGGLETRLGVSGFTISILKNFMAFSLIAAGAWAVTRRDVHRVATLISRAHQDGTAPLGRAPLWLDPIAAAAAEALDEAARRAERAGQLLRESEIRQRVAEADRRHTEAILNSLQDAVLVTDSFNELTLANPSAARVLGFDPAAASGNAGGAHRAVDQIIRDERLRQLIDEVRQSGVPARQKHVEHSLVTADSAGEAARPHTFDVTLACLPDPQNGVGGVVTILRDVTREKEISQMKTDFVSQASHELRTPLASINAYLEMLLDSEATDEASRQEFYQIIKSEADRVSRLIDNMLNISRIEAGIVTIDRAEVDFVKVVKEVLETLQPQAKTKDIMLIEKSGPLVYTAVADRDMMHQVVMNLVSNGIKYTPEGGRVTVTVENDDASRSVLVSVADTGLGIPPEAMSRIFDKFYRIENYKRVAKGTGLGLNLVKHIVETVHKGRVGVTSELGMGSRFWFSIPYEPSDS